MNDIRKEKKKNLKNKALIILWQISLILKMLLSRGLYPTGQQKLQQLSQFYQDILSGKKDWNDYSAGTITES